MTKIVIFSILIVSALARPNLNLRGGGSVHQLLASHGLTGNLGLYGPYRYPGYYTHPFGQGSYGHKGLDLQALHGLLAQKLGLGPYGQSLGLGLTGGFGGGFNGLYNGGYNGLYNGGYNGLTGGINGGLGVGLGQGAGTIPMGVSGIVPGIVPGSNYAPPIMSDVKKVFNQVF